MVNYTFIPNLEDINGHISLDKNDFNIDKFMNSLEIETNFDKYFLKAFLEDMMMIKAFIEIELYYDGEAEYLFVDIDFDKIKPYIKK
jgi:hypothetical protein